MYVCMYVCICMCVFVCMYVCMYVCVYVPYVCVFNYYTAIMNDHVPYKGTRLLSQVVFFTYPSLSGRSEDGDCIKTISFGTGHHLWR